MSMIPFLDLFMRYCEHSFDKEKSIKVYSYFLEKSEFIAATMKCNEALNEDYFMEVRCLLQEMEVDIFKHDVPIYFIECPFASNIFNQVTFQDFLKDVHKFYAQKGHPWYSELRSVRLAFDSKILQVLFEKYQPLDSGNPRCWSNNHNHRQDELYELIKNDADKILQKHGKSFRELTKEEFRKYIETELKQKDSQHVIDHLWYVLRNDSRSI